MRMHMRMHMHMHMYMHTTTLCDPKGLSNNIIALVWTTLCLIVSAFGRLFATASVLKDCAYLQWLSTMCMVSQVFDFSELS